MQSRKKRARILHDVPIAQSLRTAPGGPLRAGEIPPDGALLQSRRRMHGL
jgi:hypothetical protein